MATRVLPDANVLFSRTLRDWLFMLRLESEGSMFTVVITVDIVAEAIARLRDAKPDAPGQMMAGIHDRISKFADERLDDFRVDGSWPGLDSGDAHVHAAATDGHINVVITCDGGWDKLTDEQRDGFCYEAHHPDSFFCLVDDTNADVVREVVKKQMSYWYGRHGEVDIPDRLTRAGCPQFARRVRSHQMTMDCSFLIK